MLQWHIKREEAIAKAKEVKMGKREERRNKNVIVQIFQRLAFAVRNR